MTEGKRIFWTEYEQSEVYRVFTELVGQKKIERPVPNLYTKEGGLVMNLLRQSQLVLPENRRRSLVNIEALTPELGERLALNGYFPKNWRTFYKRRAEARKQAPATEDPQAKLIQELQARVSELEQREKDLLEQNEGLTSLVNGLRNQPTPMQMLQQAVAETLAMALDMHAASQKKGGPGGTPLGGKSKSS